MRIFKKAFDRVMTPACRSVSFEKGSVRSILVVRLNRIGDMICAIPLLKTLRQEFPDAELSVLAESSNTEIIAQEPYIDRIFVLKRGKGLVRNRFIDVKRILSGSEFDLCVGVKGGFSSSLAIMTLLSGAKYRVGYASDGLHIANMLYNIPVKKGVVIQHQILQCLDLLGPLGIASERYVLDCKVNLPPGSAERFDDFLDRNKLSSGRNKFAVINVSNNKPATAWSEDNFIRLVNGLAGIGVRSVITSAPEDHAKTERIVSACAWSAVGYETPHVMDFAAAVKKAALLVCHDSGAMHIGVAAGTRTLVLIGRGITPAVWGPYGEGHKCLGRASIVDIGPEEVTEEAIAMLKGSNE